MESVVVVVGVVGHGERAEQARRLAALVGAEYLSVDDGTLGAGMNHRRVWEWLSQHYGGADWLCCIEDDAEPVDGFRDQLAAALAVSPCSVASLYLGTGRPPKWQQRIAQALTSADEQQAHWLVTDGLLHGVGVAVRAELAPDMLRDIAESTQPIDFAIRNWARSSGHGIGFTVPSLLNHRDDLSLIRHPDGAPRTEPRRAWRVGVRRRWKADAVQF